MSVCRSVQKQNPNFGMSEFSVNVVFFYNFCLDSYFPFIWEALKRKLLREEVKREEKKGLGKKQGKRREKREVQEGKEEKEKTKQ